MTHTCMSVSKGNHKIPPRQIAVWIAQLNSHHLLLVLELQVQNTTYVTSSTSCYLTESDIEKEMVRTSDFYKYMKNLRFCSHKELSFSGSHHYTCGILSTQTFTRSVGKRSKSKDKHLDVLGTIPALYLTAVVFGMFRFRSMLYCFCVLRLIAGACCSYRDLLMNASKSVGNALDKVTQEVSSLLDKRISAEDKTFLVAHQTPELSLSETPKFHSQKNAVKGGDSLNPEMFPKEIALPEKDKNRENKEPYSGSWRISRQNKSDRRRSNYGSTPQSLDSTGCDTGHEKDQQGTVPIISKKAMGELKSRLKRNVTQKSQPPPPRSCSLHLVADYLFFLHVGGSDVTAAATAMQETLHGVDSLFRRTDFDQDEAGDNVGFTVTNVTVLQKQSFPYFYSLATTDPVLYLSNFSTMDHSNVCLAVLFTYLDFEGGVGGAAWVASSTPEADPGGICQKPVYVASKATWFSFNTALVTFRVRGRRVSRRTAVTFLALQLARSFGSSHGGSSVSKGCSSASAVLIKGDNSSTSDFVYDFRFSPCSLRLMYPVLVTRSTCLQRHSATMCGNGLREKGEECDCGNSQTCHSIDPCCTPSDVNSTNVDLPCTLRRARGFVCSPLFSLCCSRRCRPVSDTGLKCRSATDCRHRALCDGIGGECPRAPSKPNGTQCAEGTMLCEEGRCEGSACHKLGLSGCQCEDPPEARCKLCCRMTEDPTGCVPADTLSSLLPVYLPSGDPCLAPVPAQCDDRHSCLPLLLGKPLAFVGTVRHVTWTTRNGPYVLAGLVAVLLSLASFRAASKYHKDAHIKALHYGKIMAIFRIAAVLQLRIMQDIALSRYLLERYEGKVKSGVVPVRYWEAVSRIKTFFPTCPLPCIVNAVTVATSEDVVVRVLLAQGFAFRRFTPNQSSVNHILPRRSVSLYVGISSTSIATRERSQYKEGEYFSHNVIQDTEQSGKTALLSDLPIESMESGESSQLEGQTMKSDEWSQTVLTSLDAPLESQPVESQSSDRTDDSFRDRAFLFSVGDLQGLSHPRISSGLQEFRKEVQQSKHSQGITNEEASVKLVYLPVNIDDESQVNKKGKINTSPTWVSEQQGPFALLGAWIRSWLDWANPKRPVTPSHNMHSASIPAEGGPLVGPTENNRSNRLAENGLPNRPATSGTITSPQQAPLRQELLESQTTRKKDKSGPAMSGKPYVASKHQLILNISAPCNSIQPGTSKSVQ